MRIAVASGKGGAGKTFVSLHLAHLLSPQVLLVDADVEEPNVTVYLSGEVTDSRRASVLVPHVDNSKCIDCSFYSEVCEFHALIPLKGGLLVYEHNCHSCSACWTLSKDGAVKPKKEEIGTITSMVSDGIRITQGMLDEGSIATVAMIKQTKERASSYHGSVPVTIIDAPPGTSCAAIEAVSDCDLVIVVAEDTLFGYHDAQILIETLEILKQRFIVVINKYRNNESVVEPYCEEKGYPILARIPFSRDIAKVYGGGNLVFSSLPELKKEFNPLIEYLKEASQ